MINLRVAFRQLFNNPGFTAVAILSLALGIGASTALFSVVYGVLISPYPYGRPHEIWWPMAQGKEPSQRRMSYSMSEYLDLEKVSSFAEVMATRPDNMLLTGDFSPESLTTVRLTGGAFRFLQVPPVLGRVFGPSDIQPNGEPQPVAVLTFRLWQRLFAGDPDVLGKKLVLNDQHYTVIGVMPSRFGWWTGDGLWIPMAMDRRDARAVNPLVRLKPGVTRAAAEQDLHILHQAIVREKPAELPKDGYTSVLTNYLDLTVASGEMKTSLRLLFGAVGFLLLIACANVANLQLARASARAREMAIRLSVGAGRGQLIRQLLTESVLLSLLGGLLGLLVAQGITRLMVALMPSFYIPNEARIELNGPVLLFSLGVSMLTGILFGLVPALKSSRADLTHALKDTAKGSGSSVQGGRTRAALVVAEVALAMILLVSAGLTLRSFIALQNVPLGFQADGVLMVEVPLVAKRYAALDQRNRFAAELLERLKNLPGSPPAVMGNGLSPLRSGQTTFEIEGHGVAETRRILLHSGGPDYLRVFGIPLQRGRMLEEREARDATPVAVINEAAAALWPPGVDPIGQRLRLGLLSETNNPNVPVRPDGSSQVSIVGIMANSRNSGLNNDIRPEVLIPYSLFAPASRTLAVRVAGDPLAFLHTVRAEVKAMDSQQPLGRPTTLVEMLGFQTVQPRFTMALFSLVAAVGLALAVAGIYSILSYLATCRTREIGVRMALGARRWDVLVLVLRAGGKLVVAGLVIGLLVSLGVTRLLRSQLFQVTATDPVSLAGVVVLLGGVAVAACYLPARRATQVDPLVALRHE